MDDFDDVQAAVAPVLREGIEFVRNRRIGPLRVRTSRRLASKVEDLEEFLPYRRAPYSGKRKSLIFPCGEAVSVVVPP